MKTIKNSFPWKFFLLAVVFAFIGLTFRSGISESGQKTVLASKKAASAPNLDGVVDDLWKDAVPLTVQVMGGANLPGGGTEVTIRSVYTADEVHFLIQWKDPTQSLKRSPWVKQADGTWKKLKDPNDKGGDNNLYYEDKFSILWAINSPSFETSGGFSAGHFNDGGKPYGTMHTPLGELLDMWHWKSVRTGPVGQMDDQYMDSTRHSKDTPEAGRKSDPKTGGGYYDNANSDKTAPMYAPKGHRAGAPYWILDSEKELLDNSKYKAGDEVPGIIIAPLQGDRGDISAGAVWENGVWTLEITRKLVTGSKHDVQYDNLKKDYAFGVAVFDNAAVRHAFSVEVLWLRFE